MGRIPNLRCVASIPRVTYFKPVGIPYRTLEEVCLSVEEAEAVRLKDLEGLEQEECARKMSISRPTFHRVLGAARGRIADALLYGLREVILRWRCAVSTALMVISGTFRLR